MWTNLDRPPLDVSALRRALVDGPQASWSRLDVVEETGSTNADLIANAAGLADRTALVAEHQASGRGPPRSQLLMSVLVKFPGIDPSVLGWLPLLTGVAVVDALRTVAAVDAALKWPNDVLVGGRKVAGILAEVALHGQTPAVVVGIGLNVSLKQDELPVPTATSLVLENAAVTERDTLLRAILRGIGAEVDSWKNSSWNTDHLASRYRERCDTVGRRVRVELPGEKQILGEAIDVDQQGRIVVRDDETGKPIPVAAGDVTHLRAIESD
jgi:BirA family transcriptional regulator, biotin operon repressor / biotin---[acetyl-CoA-carboxylase] ligase